MPSSEWPFAATSGPWLSAQNFPCLPALDDWFTAANLNSALARPGQGLTVMTGSFSDVVGGGRELVGAIAPAPAPNCRGHAIDQAG